jgi:uncharacterized membrane protein
MNLKIASSYFLALVFILAGMAHFFAAADFIRFLPDGFPYKSFAVAATGVIEVALGIGLFIPKFRTLSAMGVLILLVIYFPLHIIDLNRYIPVVGSKAIAWVRLPAQLLMIVMAYLATQWEKR